MWVILIVYTYIYMSNYTDYMSIYTYFFMCAIDYF